MQVGELLRDHLGLAYMNGELDLLDELAGREIATISFLSDTGWLNAWNGEAACVFLGRYFVPIAQDGDTWVGVHLLPSHVASERFAIAEIDLESDHLVEHAYSVRAFLYRKLAELEADGDLQKSDLGEARAVLGADFYEEGAYELSLGSDLDHLMIDRFGGAPIDYQELFRFARDLVSVKEQVYWLKYAGDAFPDCMYFHANLAQLYERQGDGRLAARSAARSLACYHHTAHNLGYHASSQRDLADYYAWGRRLLERVPGEFTEMVRQDLIAERGASRIAWIVSLFQEGRFETSVKLLCDFCRDSRTDLHPALFRFRQRHYEQLGWGWAAAWCEMCAAGAQMDCSDCDAYMGQPLSPGWDEPVRAILEAVD